MPGLLIHKHVLSSPSGTKWTTSGAGCPQKREPSTSRMPLAPLLAMLEATLKPQPDPTAIRSLNTETSGLSHILTGPSPCQVRTKTLRQRPVPSAHCFALNTWQSLAQSKGLLND